MALVPSSGLPSQLSGRSLDQPSQYISQRGFPFEISLKHWCKKRVMQVGIPNSRRRPFGKQLQWKVPGRFFFGDSQVFDQGLPLVCGLDRWFGD